jgi:catechol 2,3-dioxygenase-like lactoylglutathione lyase family enzyme
MPRHHHVNLSVPLGGIDAQRGFLVHVIGYRPLRTPDEVLARGINASWFEADDGSQIHLSEDPNHRSQPFAHVAIELAGDELDAVRQRLAAASIEFAEIEASPGFPRVVFARDPAGNRWELREPLPEQ